mmetsp:Transcript_90/g.138  ORF Transcript_90/g.138 Transcript_90/m.138 type:complete len:149 (-) Transcript_90:173-619(-)
MWWCMKFEAFSFFFWTLELTFLDNFYVFFCLLLLCLIQSTAFAFLWVLHKPVPTIYDVFITFTLVLLSPRSVIRMGNACLVAVVSLIVPIVLFIMDYWMWLETGVGNANYMFFQCLAFNAFYATILLEFVVASLQRDKTLRLTEKETK